MEQNNIVQPIVPVTASKRIVSALIDYVPMLMVTMITNTVAMTMFFDSFPTVIDPNMSEEESMEMITTMLSSFSNMILPMSIGIAVSYVYFLCKDLIGGQSPGKRLQKLQLVRLDGSPVSYTRMILRNLFLVIWPIELIMYLANSGQRLGDLACKTTVVEATESNKQKTDKQKVIISVIIVIIFCSLIAILYSWGMTVFFDWYMRLMQNIMTNPNYGY